MTYNANDIEDWCNTEWERWKADCSGFAKAVCNHADIRLTGQANRLIDFLESSYSWESLGAEPRLAIDRANSGVIVLGGLKQQPNGHVVIVVKSPPLIYPLAYWGRLGSTGKKRSGVNWSWNRRDLDQVQYYAYRW